MARNVYTKFLVLAAMLAACGPGASGDADGGNPDGSKDGGAKIAYKVAATAPNTMTPQHWRVNGVRIEACLRVSAGTCGVLFAKDQTSCADSRTCEVVLTGPPKDAQGFLLPFVVKPEHDRYVFADKEVKVTETSPTVSNPFDGPGECAVQVGKVVGTDGSGAPEIVDQEYEDEKDGNVTRFQTKALNGHVELLGSWFPDGVRVIMTDHSFVGTGTGEQSGFSIRGSFSEDLATVAYHRVQTNGKEFDETANRR